MRFTKMHGLGNDFIIINGFSEQLPLDISAFAEQVCDRHFGLGADGLIVLMPAQSEHAVARFLIFNADGSEAIMCGNGLRCAAMFAKRNGITTDDEFVFETKTDFVRPNIIDEDLGIVTVDMGLPRFRPGEIPTTLQGEKIVGAPVEINGTTYAITLVSMGNPHCVIFVDNVENFPVHAVGARIEKHHFFPERTNVEFVQLLPGGKLKMRVWERGCGETLACGSGSCAATIAAVQAGYISNHAEVLLTHGSLHIRWDENGHIYMTGPSAVVAEGELFI